MKDQIKAAVMAQLMALRAEQEAIKEVFNGYRTDRVVILERLIPLLEMKLANFERVHWEETLRREGHI